METTIHGLEHLSLTGMKAETSGPKGIDMRDADMCGSKRAERLFRHTRWQWSVLRFIHSRSQPDCTTTRPLHDEHRTTIKPTAYLTLDQVWP
jgi:hypothetical protein